jgi:Ca2+-binding EF-hand superfamily protein
MKTCKNHNGDIQYDEVVYIDCPLCKVKERVGDLISQIVESEKNRIEETINRIEETIKTRLNYIEAAMCYECRDSNEEDLSAIFDVFDVLP